MLAPILRYWVARARIALRTWPYLAFWGTVVLVICGRRTLAHARADGHRIAQKQLDADPAYQWKLAEIRRLKRETMRIRAEISVWNQRKTFRDN